MSLFSSPLLGSSPSPLSQPFPPPLPASTGLSDQETGRKKWGPREAAVLFGVLTTSAVALHGRCVSSDLAPSLGEKGGSVRERDAIGRICGRRSLQPPFPKDVPSLRGGGSARQVAICNPSPIHASEGESLRSSSLAVLHESASNKRHALEDHDSKGCAQVNEPRSGSG